MNIDVYRTKPEFYGVVYCACGHVAGGEHEFGGMRECKIDGCSCEMAKPKWVVYPSGAIGDI